MVFIGYGMNIPEAHYSDLEADLPARSRST